MPQGKAGALLRQPGIKASCRPSVGDMDLAPAYIFDCSGCTIIFLLKVQEIEK